MENNKINNIKSDLQKKQTKIIVISVSIFLLIAAIILITLCALFLPNKNGITKGVPVNLSTEHFDYSFESEPNYIILIIKPKYDIIEINYTINCKDTNYAIINREQDTQKELNANSTYKFKYNITFTANFDIKSITLTNISGKISFK